MEVTRAAYPDPTAIEGDWVCVDIKPVEAWDSPVSLDRIRAEGSLSNLLLLSHSRLSVSPIPEAAWKRIGELTYG